jgi:hypothetical protein
MKDEIKEILDRLNKDKDEIKHYCYYPDDVLTCEELVKLIDYITNLQKERDKNLDNVMFLSKVNDEKQDIIDKAIEILNQLNETLPTDLVYSEIAHAEYILQGSDEDD